MNEWRHLERIGQHGKADLIWKIASQPKALWLGRFTRPNFSVKVRRLIDPAREQRRGADLHRAARPGDGLQPDLSGRRPRRGPPPRENWYDDLARVIGDDRVVIAFEPDSLGTIDCLAPSRRDDRLRVLGPRRGRPLEAPQRHGLHRGRRVRLGVRGAHRQAAAQGRREQGARVHAQRDPLRLDREQHPARARHLAAAGRQALHHQHGRERSRRGALQDGSTAPGTSGGASPSGATRACAASGRPRPPTTSHPDKVDAYLWINRPGFAQSCQHRPIAWYLPRALTLRQFATDWEQAPPGTRFGFKQHYPLKAFIP